VRRLLLAIQNVRIPGVIETVPAYRSLLIHYDPLKISSTELRDRLETLEQSAEDSEFPRPTVTEIPTVYGNEYGPDLEFVAKHHGLTPEEAVQIHTSTTYLIYMIGFLPGQPYLGGMSPRIATPRLETPRSKVLRGSVGIAGNLTGIYAVESPGGWQIIGRTPIRLFDPHKEPPALLQAGNYVTFVRITLQEYTRIEEMLQQGTYKVKETQMA
jgi:KipI family sensor histidine kinase inhibitor